MLHHDSRLGLAGACLLACTLLSAACSDLPTSAADTAASRLSPESARARPTIYTTNGTVTRVVIFFVSGAIDRTSWTLPVGTTEQFGVTAYDSVGRVITGRAVTFKSSNASVLAVDSTGLATGLAVGFIAHVSATVGGVTGQTGGFSVKAATTPAPATLPVTRVAVSYVSGAMDTTTWTLPAGGTERFTAAAYDSTGARVAGTAVYRTSNAAVLTVDSTTGLATAVTSGTATVSAAVAGVTGSSRTITVPAGAPAPTPTPTPVPAPAPSSRSVPIAVVRFDGATGPVTVSSGLPLTPGMLQPGQEGMVRITVGGVEQAAYVTGLPSLHPDGSLRSVLVQFRLASLGSTAATGRVDFASARPTAMRVSAPLVTPGTAIAGTPTGLPQAAALPTSPTYLIATDLVGPTTTAAANAALGGAFARYESDFVSYANLLWGSEGYDWVGDYYDRVLIYYAMWARTGDATYWARAGQIAYDYRTKYLEPNAYGSSPHWAQLEGLEKHYLLTGDDMSRVAVAKTADRLYTGFAGTTYMSRVNGESRIAARVLHSQLLAWRLSTPTSPAAGVSQGAWGTRVESALNKIFVWQQPDGSFPADGQVCGGQLNYMVGQQNDALIKTYDYYLPATTSRATLQTSIRNVVKKAVDYMWTTQWLSASRAFKYSSVTCAGVGDPSASPDLNSMIAAGFGWLYKMTGTASYLTQGDQIFTSGVTQSFLSGSKQFNEAYTSSFRYLGYR